MLKNKHDSSLLKREVFVFIFNIKKPSVFRNSYLENSFDLNNCFAHLMTNFFNIKKNGKGFFNN